MPADDEHNEKGNGPDTDPYNTGGAYTPMPDADFAAGTTSGPPGGSGDL